MSVLIRGMEMPTRCEDCFCYRHNAEYDYAYCNISSVNVRGHGNARLVNCPLVPVPPHGRLIDAGNLAARAFRYLLMDEEESPKVIFANAVKDAPTIIEGDKE